ncbi:MAG: hypothetical protein WC378_03895 [Opitutaceae bacterium]|jgi:hypothetical protein
MKRIVLCLSCLASSAFGQWIVNDPVNTAVNTLIQSGQVAQHAEVINRWAENLERLNQQIRQLEDQLAVQRRIRDAMGDPGATGVVLRELGANELAHDYGETMQAIRRLANASDSLRNTLDGTFTALDDRTALGAGFARQTDYYRRYAAVERQAEQMAVVQTDTDARRAALQTELAAALEQLRVATTQAEVDKLNIRVAALNGQLAEMAARRRDESDKLRAQQILNENQSAKERQDLLEKQSAEERRSLAAVNAWQSSLRLAPASYTSP